MGSDDEAGPTLPEVTTTFGVSGYLMESDVLIYDRASQSLWSQISAEAVAGPRAGTALTPIAIVDTTWSAWSAAHPTSKVLNGPRPDHQYGRAYGRYHASEKVMFPLSHRSDRLRNKAVVTGVRVGGNAACWSHDALKERAAARDGNAATEPLDWTETVGATKLTLRYDPAGDSVTARAGDEDVALMRAYWFAWHTFHPQTSVDGEAPAEPADEADDD